MEHGTPEREPLLPPEGEVAGHAVLFVAELRHFEHPRLACLVPVAHYAVQPGEELDVLAHGQIGVQRELLRHVADPFPDGSPVLAYVEPGDPAGSLRGREQAGEHLDRGGLACAVGPQEAEDLPGADREGDRVDRHEVAEAPGQTVHLDGVDVDRVDVDRVGLDGLGLDRAGRGRGVVRSHPTSPMKTSSSDGMVDAHSRTATPAECRGSSASSSDVPSSRSTCTASPKR